MIISFDDADTKELFFTEGNRRFSAIARVALRKLFQLNRAVVLKDLSIPPGNRLEALKGKAQGWYSIRINDQWLIVFQWTDDGKANVAIVDHH
ncbi:MAG: type II toxin-antitoxin system RelE/ParE family toxin [Chthoniobacterales bacterium]|nr:type II toxin-antitoxin system RelE/ParE family toxin [Chthoniobacterales bacterium]